MAAQHPAADSADLVVAVPDAQLPATLRGLGLDRQTAGARAHRLRLFDAPSLAGGLRLASAGVSVRSVRDAGGGREPDEQTVVTLHRARRSVLAAWSSADRTPGGTPGGAPGGAPGTASHRADRPLRIQEWRGEEARLVLSLAADRRPDRGGDADPDGAWDLLLTTGQRELVRLGAEVDLDAVRPIRSGPLDERLWPLRQRGIDMVVRRWTEDVGRHRGAPARGARFDALELCCRASLLEAPFLRVALRAVASDLGLDAGSVTAPIDLRAATQLLAAANR